LTFPALTEVDDEAFLSAEPNQEVAYARFPCTHGDGRWPQCSSPPSREGPPPPYAVRREEVIVDAPQSGGADDQRFRKRDRLLKREDFLRVQQNGRKFTTPRMTVLCVPSPTGKARVGLTVSKKVGCSPVRARVRRVLREIYRQNRGWWPETADIVVIARAAAADAPYSDLEADLERWSLWARKGRQC
jgi:ribonuclease P protein component